MDLINKHNADGSRSFKLEMNHLGDLTADEFNHMLNGLIPTKDKTVILFS